MIQSNGSVSQKTVGEITESEKQKQKNKKKQRYLFKRTLRQHQGY